MLICAIGVQAYFTDVMQLLPEHIEDAVTNSLIIFWKHM